MVTVRVNRGFADLLNKVDREAGEEFAATEERAEELQRRLPPGFVEVVGEAKAPAEDLASSTVAELAELARERGIAIKGRATKAKLIEALSKE